MFFARVLSLQMLLVILQPEVLLGYGKLSVVQNPIVLRAPCRCHYACTHG